jgi:hypothetical protein
MTQLKLSAEEAPASREDADKKRVRIKVGGRVTIYRTEASPNWYLDYSVDGHQFRQSLKTHNKKQAQRLAEKKDAELVLGMADGPTRRGPRIRDAANDHLNYLQRSAGRRGRW